MSKRQLHWMAGWAISLGLIFGAQAAAQSDVIRVSSNLVAVPVLVTDGAGTPILDLAATDFRLEQDSRPQRIVRLGEPGSAPIDLALLFVESASIAELL